MYNVMYLETGQGSALSADAHYGLDQQTCEARAYAVARHFDPLLVNTVVGFIGPEYLFDDKEIIRAGLEDHFCGKLLVVAGCNFIMGIPGSDDIMLNYQTTSFHDALYARRVLGPAPEFEHWLVEMAIFDDVANRRLNDGLPGSFARSLASLPSGADHDE